MKGIVKLDCDQSTCQEPGRREVEVAPQDIAVLVLRYPYRSAETYFSFECPRHPGRLALRACESDDIQLLRGLGCSLRDVQMPERQLPYGQEWADLTQTSRMCDDVIDLTEDSGRFDPGVLAEVSPVIESLIGWLELDDHPERLE